MSDVFEVLTKDHAEVKRMCRELERGPSMDSGATDEQLTQRKELVEQLIIEESRHEAVEEEFFWPTVRKMARNGEDLADVAVGQEDKAKHVLDELRQLDADNPQFELLLARFIKDGSEHIEYEETQVWPPLSKVLNVVDSNELANKIVKSKSMAPTRPHPKTPAKPGVLKTAGAAAAMLDRARDAATGRGKKD